MSAHSPLAHLFPQATHSATTHGQTLGAPRVYDAFVSVFFVGRRRSTFTTLLDVAQVRPGQRVLDVGCGTGYFARLFAQRVGPDGLVVGVDASQDMVDYARRQSRSMRNCQFQLGAAESLALPTQGFDVVVSSLFMHHLPGELQSQALNEMQRVLQPGGTLLIAEAHVPEAAGWRLLAHLHGFDRMAQTVPDLERMIAAAGFDRLEGGLAPPWLRYVRAVKP